MIERLARGGRWFTVRDIAEAAGVSRQAAHRPLARWRQEGALLSEGKGRATRYRGIPVAPSAKEGPPPTPRAEFDRVYPLAGLAEDSVWQHVDARLRRLSSPAFRNARAIVQYALTEMVNNAIDHSGAREVRVRASAGDGRAWFLVEDAGVGAFERMREGLGLPDVLAGLQEISKGKRTSQPARHSGEGLFFTSKVADEFELVANGLRWIVDNRRRDQAVGTAPGRPGTAVRFEVAIDKRDRLEEVFARYTHDFEFDTTRTIVKLFSYGVRFVARSEARRLLDGLARFRHVILDFRGVESVGQGFVDEVFRVWAGAHPEVELTAENMSAPVAFMVGRARSPV